MEKEQVLETVKGARNTKRNFPQSVDLIMSLTGLDLKKPEHQVDLFVTLPNPVGKKSKICALVAHELSAEAKKVCDTVVLDSDFAKYAKDRKSLKRLVREHAYFLGQANIMPKIATTFGRILGPKGKMPNPKAGCIVPPKAALKPLYNRLQNTVRLTAKTAPVIHCRIGNETLNDEQLAQNLSTVYEHIIHVLPHGETNINAAYVKLTMGKPVKVLSRQSEGKLKARARAE